MDILFKVFKSDRIWILLRIYRSSCPELFLVKDILKICRKFTGQNTYAEVWFQWSCFANSWYIWNHENNALPTCHDKRFVVSDALGHMMTVTQRDVSLKTVIFQTNESSTNYVKWEYEIYLQLVYMCSCYKFVCSLFTQEFWVLVR